MKMVISEPATRKAYQVEIDDTKVSVLIGKRIGEEVSGDSLGVSGYSLKITGGSDNDGFPMRPEIPGSSRKALMMKGPPGFNPKLKGQVRRKLVCGNTVSQSISQVNVKVIKAGDKKLEEVLGVKEKPKEEKSTDKKEEKAAEKKEEKIAEVKKEAPVEKKEEKKVDEKQDAEKSHDKKE